MEIDIPRGEFRILITATAWGTCARCSRQKPCAVIEVLNHAGERLAGRRCWKCLPEVWDSFEVSGSAKHHGALRKWEGFEGHWRR